MNVSHESLGLSEPSSQPIEHQLLRARRVVPALLLVLGGTVALETSPAPALGATTAVEASPTDTHANPGSGGPPGTYAFEWKITHKKRLPHRDGFWRDCVSFDKSPVRTDVTCSLANSSTHTVTTSVGGSVEVKLATLSSSVGYDVAHTTEVTRSYTAHVPAHRSGKIHWRPTFNDRYRVEQQMFDCYASPDGEDGCTIDTSGRFKPEYATTERYDDSDFQTVIYGHHKKK